MITVSMQIRPADRYDMARSKKELRYGQVFFLKSVHTGKYSGPYNVNEDTDPLDISMWLQHNMIYVPISPLEGKGLKAHEITANQNQATQP